MTETQIKMGRFLLVAMFGISFYQALLIRELSSKLKYGRQQFNKLHEGTDYLLKIIEENDIELTEFDVIALTAISEDNNASS